MSAGSRSGDEERALERERMVAEQIIARGVRDPRVIAALRRIPRHRFVPAEHASRAYEDGPLSIGEGQTISQPYMVARMCALLVLTGSERLLEIGAGSGYQTALLAELAREVFAVERLPGLAAVARERLADLGVTNVLIESFDGTVGWPAHAPYEAIVVAAGSPRVPPLLCDQLADGGRLVLPVGSRASQRLAVVTRRGEEWDLRWDERCRFVDLVGRFGWGRTEPPSA